MGPRRLVGDSAVHVWVDEQGRVRRRVATYRLDDSLSIFPGLTVTTAMEFYDFGIPVDVRLPRTDEPSAEYPVEVQGR